MIVVDTSVWIRAFRSASSSEAIALGSLLDADAVAVPVPVRSELLMGARAADRAKLERQLRGVPLLYPTDESWRTLDDWTRTASAAGLTFAIADLLIGVLTAEIGGLVWSKDGDFARLETLGLVQRFDA